MTCRVLEVSRSGFYEWVGRGPSQRDWDDAHLCDTIVDIHTGSRCSYGSPRVHAELTLGLGVRVGRKRVARLMRGVGVVGISHCRKRGRPRVRCQRSTTTSWSAGSSRAA